MIADPTTDPHAASDRLPRSLLAHSLRLSLLEGVLWSIMVGLGETYFLADAVRLGAAPLEQALVVTLPLAAGAAGPLLSLLLCRHLGRRKPLVVWAAAAQVLILFALCALELEGALRPRALIAAACLYQVAALAGNNLWNSWFGDLVPVRMRGRYFARRNRRVQIGLFGGLIAGGLALQGLEPRVAGDADTAALGFGFALLFGLAGLMRLGSVVLLARTPEPRFSGLAAPAEALSYLRTDRGHVARRVLMTGGLIQLATYLASPFFVPFMLRGLRFSYLEFMAATAAVVAAKVLFLPRFGRLIDAHGGRPLWGLAATLTTLVPLPWLLFDLPVFQVNDLVLVLVAQAFSGAAWACYEVSYFTLLLETSTPRTRPWVFAGQNLANGPSQLLGSLCGSFVLRLAGGSFFAVFAASAAARLLVAAVMLPMLPHLRSGGPRRRDLALRIIGWRADGGVVTRPVLAGNDKEEEEERSTT